MTEAAGATVATSPAALEPRPAPRTYEALAAALAEGGVDRIFCVLGDANLELLAEAATAYGISLVHARHEQGAVAMADGYARASAAIGVCSVTSGPGLTNAATSLATAVRHGSAVLLIAGDVALGDRRHVQRLDQRRFVESLGVPCLTGTSPSAALVELASAVRHVRGGHGPVVLDLPVDVQHATLSPGDRSPGWLTPLPQLVEPDPAVTADVARALRDAKRPAILAGRGALKAKHSVVGLAEALGAPIVTTLRAKGLAHGHPLDAGVSGALGQQSAEEALRAADVICALGARLDDWTTSGGRLLANASAVIQIDTESRMLSDVPYVTLPVLGDAGCAAQRLTALLAPDPAIAVASWWTPPAPAAAGPCGCAEQIHPGHAVRVLDAALGEHRFLVLDGGHFAIFTAQGLHVPDPARFLFTSDFGAIGQALGIAIGAALATRGERVTAVLGDGCLMMSLSDLDTVAQLNLPLTIFVMNDEAYGQERHSLVAKGYPPAEALHRSPDLVALATAAGLRAHAVRTCAELERVPEILADPSGPVLLDVRIDGEVLNPAARKIFESMRSAAR